MGKLCNVIYAKNEKSDLQIFQTNAVVLFIQVITKQITAKIIQNLRKVSTKKKANNEEKIVLYISSEIRHGMTPQVIKFDTI